MAPEFAASWNIYVDPGPASVLHVGDSRVRIRVVHRTFTFVQRQLQHNRRRLDLEIDEVPQHSTHDPMLPVRRETVICATCELEVPWTPVRLGARAYCCEGCAVGGPCFCSYDDISGGGTRADPVPAV